MTDDSLLGQLAEEFTRRVREGTQPEIEEYARKHPELADRIRELFPTLMFLEGMAADRGPAAEVTPSLLPAGSVFGNYRIEREIGSGGMGIVYEAVHVLLEKRVALKVLPVRTPVDAGRLERFFREARTAAGLHHTNIVPVFDVGQVAGTPYFAMQYIEGRGLDQILRTMQSAAEPSRLLPSSSDANDTAFEAQRSSGQGIPARGRGSRAVQGPMDPSARIRAGLPAGKEEYFRWVAGIGIQAAEGLAYAHERKVIHRDIKPSNLLLDNQGVLWVADFGLARRIEDPALTQQGVLVGTPRYMSPEQAEVAKRPVDQRSDIYSLGATLYELLTLRPVFEGKTPQDVLSQILTREPAAPRGLNPEIPADLATIVMKAMAKRPEERYQSARDLADDLQRWMKMEPIKARPIGPLGRTIRWCRRNPRVAAVTATALAVIIALTAIYITFLTTKNQEIRTALDRAEREAKGLHALIREDLGIGQASHAARATTKDGWFKAGSAPEFYKIGDDQNVRDSGASSLYLFSTSEMINGFGIIMKQVQPGEYLGKRVRMSAFIKAENVARRAGMYMRVDGLERNSEKPGLAFDDMRNRPISGTVDWKRYEIVLDVPQNAVRIAFGGLTWGSGKVWLDDLKFEIVDAAQTGSSTAFITGGSSQTQSLGGDFEQQHGWYPTIVPGTRQYTTFEWDSHIYHSGSHSVSIAVAPNHPTNQRIAYNWTKVVRGFQEGKSYELTGWVRAEHLKGTAYICVYCLDTQRSEMLDFATTWLTYPVSGTSDWTKVRTAFTVPKGTGEIRIRAGIEVPEDIGGKVWFDDIDIRESR